ncbi:MAG: PriCT-2 domain-containing protein [Lewinellaceae bacterium]|nr:PriCT-2 domain-containing protein [Lewinellaceae bacterium]
MTSNIKRPAKGKRTADFVSVFKSVLVKDGTPPQRVLPVDEFFAKCSDPDNEKLVNLTTELRALKAKSPEDYKEARRKRCSAVCLGKWESRGSLDTPSSLLAFDVDGGDEHMHRFNLGAAHKSPYIRRMDQSLGGGTRVWIEAEFEQEQQQEAYLAICEHLAETFDIPVKYPGEKEPAGEHIDGSTGDVTRMWYPAYTPANLVYQPENYEVFKWEGKITGEEDNRGGGDQPRRSGKYLVEFTHEEKVNDVIRQITERGIDITNGVETWFIKILLPLAHEYGEAGRHLAHQVSQFHDRYDPAQTDKEFTRALGKDRGAVTIGSFLDHAKAQGITYDAARIISARGNGKPKINGSSWEVASPPTPSPAGIRIIPPAEVQEKELPPPKFPLKIKKGRYECPASRGSGRENVTNFTITPLYLLLDNQAPKRIMELQNVNGEKTVICCSVKALTSPREFAAIVEGKGNFVPSFSSNQFALIKEYLYQHEETAEEVTVLGHLPENGYYAFANGIFDGKAFYQANEYGIASIGELRFYLPAFSKVNEDAEREYHNERKFVFENGNTTFKEWGLQLVKTFHDNAKIGICFVVAAAFRDVVFAHANCFPLLFLFGPKGTGKTTFRQAMRRLFGNYGPNDAIGLESASSPRGFSRKLAQVRNGLEAFEEYKNRIDKNLIGMLKNVYDGIGYERAQTSNDNRTHATLVNSAVILGGQEMPTKENALFSRVLMLTFSKTKFDDGEKAAFRGLEEMISAGLGNVLLEILRHREVVAAQFGFEFSTVYGHLRRDGKTNHLDERTLANVAAILAPFRVLSGLLDFPFDYEAIYRLMREKVIEQHDQMTKTSEVSEFWQIIDSEEGQSFFRGTHYVVRGEHLYLDFNRAFKIYKEQAIKQQLNHLDKATLESYLTMQPYFERPQGKGETDRLKSRVVMEEGGPQRRCLKFRHESLDLDFIKTKT